MRKQIRKLLTTLMATAILVPVLTLAAPGSVQVVLAQSGHFFPWDHDTGPTGCIARSVTFDWALATDTSFLWFHNYSASSTKGSGTITGAMCADNTTAAMQGGSAPGFNVTGAGIQSGTGTTTGQRSDGSLDVNAKWSAVYRNQNPLFGCDHAIKADINFDLILTVYGFINTPNGGTVSSLAPGNPDLCGYVIQVTNIVVHNP